MPEMDRAYYDRVKSEFVRISELSDECRRDELDRLNRGDPGLAEELQRLLSAASQELLSLDAISGGGPPAFLRYRVVREIGRGGMGRVWLAERDDGAFRGQVAIKQIDRDTWCEVDERRFLRERQILAALDHPHIARLIDGGSDARGRPFLVTWFIEGHSITRHCETFGLGPRARLSLLRKLADAVAYAHRQLVVHRDIKPGNVLVDSHGEPRLLDFGIAAVLDGGSTATTSAGAAPLTLRYAAPEQILGERAAIACDIHALGCLMYELLAGEPPHAGIGPAALTHCIVHEMPQPPSAIARRLGRPLPSRDMDAVCLKALRKRPQDRYLNAGDWAADLDRLLAGEPVQARRGERGYAARRWLRLRWPRLAAACVLVVLVSYHVASINRQLAAVARERDRAEELADFTLTLFQSAKPAEIREGRISALALLDRAAERLDGPEANELRPEVQAALVAALGHVYYEIGLREHAARHFERATKLFEMAVPTPEDDVALHQRYLAMALYDLGRTESALAWIDKALERRERLGDRDSPILASLNRAAAVYAASLEQMERAREHYTWSIHALEMQLPDARDELAITLGNAADLDLSTSRIDEAELRTARGMELLDSSSSVFYRNNLFLRRLMAKILAARGRFDEALPMMRKARDDARAQMGKDHPDLLNFAHDEGVILTRAGRLVEAGEAFDEALAIGLRADAHASRRLLGVRGSRARWLIAQARFAEAIDELSEVLAEREKTPQLDRRSQAQERVALAYAQCRLGHPQASRNLNELVRTPDAQSAALRPGAADDFARWQADCAAASGAGRNADGRAPPRRSAWRIVGGPSRPGMEYESFSSSIVPS